jgi:hypothetical protein
MCKIHWPKINYTIFFYNPLQVAKDDQGQDSNDVGIGGSSNNL